MLPAVSVVHALEVKAVPSSPEEVVQMKWWFKSFSAAIISIVCSFATVGCVYALSVSYPDTMEGPTWILSFLAYAPFLFATIFNRESLAQIYLATFPMLIWIWVIIPRNVGLSANYGAPFGVGFAFYLSISLHIWVKASGSGQVGLPFLARFVCFFMVTAYIVANKYGILVSIAIQLYRSAFLLQPIQIFGFGSLEAFVISVSGLVALIAHAAVTNRSVFKSYRKNPILYLAVLLGVWISLAGIISAFKKEITTVKVSTMGPSDLGFNDSGEHWYKYIGRKIQEKILKTGSDFVVLPETFIGGGDANTCKDIIIEYIAPFVVGHGAHVTIGCSQYTRLSSCASSNLAFTVRPDGSITSMYGKMQPTPGEKSCTQPGYFSHEYSPVNGKKGFKFSSLICYDMDFIDPAAKSADLGSALILNPSNDWKEVRHHFAASVIKAVENRVAVVKAERFTDAAIIDPFGNIVALGGGKTSTSLTAEIPISEPLKLNWFRQHFVYWLFLAGYTFLTVSDLLFLWRKRRGNI